MEKVDPEPAVTQPSEKITSDNRSSNSGSPSSNPEKRTPGESGTTPADDSRGTSHNGEKSANDATIAVDSPPEKGGKYYVKLWTYATPIDVCLRLCGFFAACGAGAALPLMTIVFGALVNDFNSFTNPESTEVARAEALDQLRSAINTNVLWFVYLFIGKFTLVYIHTCCFSTTAIRATRAIRQQYISSLLRQDIAYFDECSPGSVATSISNNCDLIQTGMSEKIGTIIQGLSMLISAFIVAFTRQAKLTAVTATTLPGAVIAVGVTIALDARLETKILDIYSKAGGLVEESLGSVRIVTAFNANEKLSKKYEAYLEVAKKFGVKKGPVLGTMYSSEFFMMFAAYSLCFWYGVRLLVRGEIDSAGTIITVLFSVVLATSSITLIAPSFGDVAKAAAASKSVLDLIAQVPKIDSTSDVGEKPEKVSGTITLENITFAYPARPTVRVLDDLTVTFEAQKVTAIVGSSGSGKSTCVGLLERWYDAPQGRVMFDGKDIKDLNLRWLRSQIGLVGQEPVLFNDTIYNNVVHGLYGSEMDDLPEPEKRKLVQAACLEANADHFIQELSNRYDTLVGEKGGFLSGGQKQRIAIARSIISNPKVLLLDEATSALDPQSEGIVQAALDRVSKSRTTIMIAHKLSTVKKANKIVVINNGRLVEQGTHEVLVAAQGAYSRLVNAQNLGDTGETEPENNKVEELELELSKIQTTHSVKSAKPALAEENISRKLSLFKCLCIIFYEQRRWWHLLLAGGFFSIMAGAVFPAQAVLFARIVTVFNLPENLLESRANFWALMYFVLALGTLVSYASLGFFLTVAAFLITRFYRGEYFSAMLRQDISFYDLDSNSSGALTARLSSDPQRLQDLISANLGLIIIVIVNLLSCCTLALIVGWKLSLVAIAGCLPPLFFAGFMRTRLEMQSQDRNAALYQESARFAAEAVGAIRTVSSLTLETKILKNYGDRLNLSVRKSYKHTAVTMLLFGLSDSLDLVALALAFWYGGKLLLEGGYTPTEFFTILIALVFGGQAAGFLFGYTLNTTKAHAAANQILHLRKQRPPINTSTGTEFAAVVQEATKEMPTIEFRDVRFTYPTRPELPVLRGLNLTIKPGQTVGIVGASGCGKTTIITLLERFYEIGSGQILIHGQPLSSLDVKDYRSNVGLVSQDTTLYQGSLKENILLGLGDDDEDANGERLIAACKAANIHDFIMSLPEGFQTAAGSRGLALSGGQRQRIAIARALVRNPSILLLDEATSALDTESEKVVQAALETAAKGRTVVAVAHRLSTIRSADCIFVLDAGRVVESGTHAELSRRRGRYWDMVQAQSLDREAK